MKRPTVRQRKITACRATFHFAQVLNTEVLFNTQSVSSLALPTLYYQVANGSAEQLGFVLRQAELNPVLSSVVCPA